MSNKKNNRFIVILLSYIFLSIFLINTEVKVSVSTPDVWENHTVAVNFAQHNQFPFLGIIGQDSTIYQLESFHESSIDDSHIKCRFFSSGPVLSFYKPPLYGILLGISYKIAGIDLRTAYYLNCIFLYLIVLLIIQISSILFLKKGDFIGGAIAIIYLLIGEYELSNVLSQNLLILLALIVAYYTMLVTKKTTNIRIIFLGFFLVLSILTKGIMLIISVLIIIYFCYTSINRKKILPHLAILFTTIIISALPWVIYSNYMRIKVSDDIVKWQKEVAFNEKKCIKNDILYKNKDKKNSEFRSDVNRALLTDSIVTMLMKRYTTPDKFILISNQAPIEGFLEVHNEYCLDGSWHPEWIIKKDAIYNNNYLNVSPIWKIIYFYRDNPQLIIKIATAKIKRATEGKLSIFLLTSFLFSCYMILVALKISKLYVKLGIIISLTGIFIITRYLSYNEHIIFIFSLFVVGACLYRKRYSEDLPYIIPSYIGGIYIILTMFIGIPRYVNFTTPLMLLTSTYILSQLIKKLTIK